VIFKYETATSLSYLADSTIIDTYQYEIFQKPDDFMITLARQLRLNNYYSISNKSRYTILETGTKTPLTSVVPLYKNAA
jgi:hypothetical protein